MNIEILHNRLCLLIFTLLFSSVLSTGAFSCDYRHTLSECTATNTGAACYKNNYYDTPNLACIPRKFWTNGCIFWNSLNSDTEIDPGCLSCVDGTYLSVNETKHDSNIDWSYFCNEGSVGVDNCKWEVQLNKTGTEEGKKSNQCSACDLGYFPSEYLGGSAPIISSSLFKTCTKSATGGVVQIKNCQYLGMIGATTYKCYSCEEGYALDNAGTGCVQFLGDQKCNQVDSSGTKCKRCWWPWWFNNFECANSKLITVMISTGIMLGIFIN